MKGGITSGIVYPPAVVELSKTYTFKNIGGTSAGAIAAAVTAAAEYGRQNGSGGFSEVAKLPEYLGYTVPNGKQSRLFSLFQPQPQTKRLFSILVAGIGNKGAKPLRIALAVILSFWQYALVGALPGLILGFTAVSANFEPARLLFWGTLLAAALLVLLGIVVLVSWGFYRSVTVNIPENGYGICSGFSSGQDHSKNPMALTPWLSRLINRAAGMKEDGPPLTFGHLWQTDRNEAEHKINLQMMTTNLTHGRPYRLPFSENVFYFDPSEFRRLFPEEVVGWMDQHAGPSTKYSPLRLLPKAADLPVVFAARLSLSFPFLLSAVPLYAIDYSRPDVDQARPEKCWFSDGGICSNFPVHFFDQALPRWPTFAINLRPYHPDYKDSPVWMPNKNVGGIMEWWTRFDQGSGLARLTGFVGAIVNSMQNWMDNTQTHLPGYRDRVAHISLDESTEGGINLNMPPFIIKSLSDRGRMAAAMLVDRFTSPAGAHVLSWDNHRWVRYRSLMNLLQQLVEEVEYSFENPIAGEESYWDLIKRDSDVPPLSYRWLNDEQRWFGIEATEELLKLVQEWRNGARDLPTDGFGGRVPRPQPELRVRPKI